MTISEPAAILGAGTAVLAILFGARLAMRAMSGGTAAPETGGETSITGGSGPPDVPGVIALPPLIFLAFLVAATALEAVVPLPLLAAHALARYLAGAALAVAALPLPMGASALELRPCRCLIRIMSGLAGCPSRQCHEGIADSESAQFHVDIARRLLAGRV